MDDSKIIELYMDRSEQAISETSKKYGRYWIVEDSKDIFKGLSKSKIKVAAYNYIINGNKNYINIKDTIDNTTINFDDVSLNAKFSIVPIIASSDSLGLVIIVANDDKDYGNLARLMAKILSEKINIYW